MLSTLMMLSTLLQLGNATNSTNSSIINQTWADILVGQRHLPCVHAPAMSQTILTYCTICVCCVRFRNAGDYPDSGEQPCLPA